MLKSLNAPIHTIPAIFLSLKDPTITMDLLYIKVAKIVC